MGRLRGNEIPPQNLKIYKYLRKGLPSTFKCRKVGSSSPCTQPMLITTKNCNLKISLKTAPKPKKSTQISQTHTQYMHQIFWNATKNKFHTSLGGSMEILLSEMSKVSKRARHVTHCNININFTLVTTPHQCWQWTNANAISKPCIWPTSIFLPGRRIKGKKTACGPQEWL